MDEFEIRAKSAEISVLYSAHMTPALMACSGLKISDMQLTPLELAPDIEEYIRTGKLPDAIEVKRTVK